MADNDKLLEEIRKDHEKFRSYWRPIFDEGDTDMRFISGDPWPPEERELRFKKRMCLSFDQLGQYVNQLVNEVKANPRSIKVLPAGDGADDKSAERRAEIIRGIEYKSNAQLAYTWGFQGAVQSGFGPWRVTAKFVSDSKFEQELAIERILNRNTVLLDPYAQKRDFSDMERAFVITSMSKDRFEEEFPKAEVKGFGAQWEDAAPGWFTDESVQIAEYWRAEKKKKTLYLLANGQTVETLPTGVKAVKKRDASTTKIKQYLTNGLEILETIDWPGEYIPIIPCFGRELWLADGGKTKRVFMSLIRLARDAQMLYAFMRTNEAEEAKMTPKASWQAVKGQLEGSEQDYLDSYDQPKVVLYHKARTDETGDQILEAPKRTQFIPNFQAYSFAAEDCRRDVQAAMGTSALPTAAQRQNEKSGVALQRIEAQMSKGSYDFIDGYEVALQHTGRIINPLLKVYYNKPRDVGAQKADRTYFTMRVNDPNFVNPETKQSELIDLSKGEYDVTISTGPSFDSQREEANQFVDLLVSNLKNLPVPPPVIPKLLGLAVRLKALGPIGDKMADLLDPKEGEQGELPPQVMAMVQKLQQENQALDAFGKQAQQQLAQMQAEKDSKAMELKNRMDIAQLDADTKLKIAQMQDKTKRLLEAHASAHEGAMSHVQHGRDRETAENEEETAGTQEEGQPLELAI